MIDLGLNGRTIVVTGGGSGIGQATAIALARQRANVAILDQSADALDATLPQLQALSNAVAVQADVRDETLLKQAAETIGHRLGEIYGLVASAGTSAVARAEDMPAADWARVMDVNALGMLLCCQVFGRPMIANRSGSIVLVGSTDSFGAQAGRIGYAASKFAVHGMVKSLALEWGRHQVRVNGVAPGLIDTPLARRGVPPSFFDLVVDRTPLGRTGSTEDVANAVMTLLCDVSSFVTGVMLPVDGGLTTGFFNKRSGADLSSNKLLADGIYDE